MNSSSSPPRDILVATGDNAVIEVDPAITEAVVIPHGSLVHTIRLVSPKLGRFEATASMLIRNESTQHVYVTWRHGSTDGTMQPLGPSRWAFSRFVDQAPDLVGWRLLAQGAAYWTP